MKNSAISWCDHTFNPWEGCTQVSPGCANCYALTRNKRFAGGENWGKGAPRPRTSEANWQQPLKWNKQAEEAQRAHGQSSCPSDLARPRVFCASLADWLDDEVPIEWLADLMVLIDQTPNLDWLLLTKRPENFFSRIVGVHEHLARCTFAGREVYLPIWPMIEGWLSEGNITRPPSNVWLGTSVENQEMADKRIPLLLSIPAKVRFLSCEPLLGKVDLENVVTYKGSITTEKVHALRGLKSRFDVGAHCEVAPDHEPKVHWVICGGESGPNARPMHPNWARSLRDQCLAAGVPFHFKQWGEFCPDPLITVFAGTSAKQATIRVGKHAAGRLLDGREWNEVPR